MAAQGFRHPSLTATALGRPVDEDLQDGDAAKAYVTWNPSLRVTDISDVSRGGIWHFTLPSQRRCGAATPQNAPLFILHGNKSVKRQQRGDADSRAPYKMLTVLSICAWTSLGDTKGRVPETGSTFQACKSKCCLLMAAIQTINSLTDRRPLVPFHFVMYRVSTMPRTRHQHQSGG